MFENKTTLSRVQIHNLEGLWICILCGKMDSDSASYYADRLDKHQIPWHVQNHIACNANKANASKYGFMGFLKQHYNLEYR